MALPLTWPSLLVPQQEGWRLTNASRSGGTSALGIEQVVQSPAARWAASLAIPIFRDDQILAARALIAGLDGRAGTVLVGPRDGRRVPWNVDPLTGGRITPGAAARSAAIDPAYGTNPDTTVALDFTLGALAAVNATGLTIQRNRGGLLAAGMYFSIAGRLHLITALTTADTGLPGAVGVTIRPWLRADYVAGTAIEFAAPVSTMRLASDDTGALDLELGRFGTLTLDLIEAV